MLYLVPTPIGNLADITLRSLDILKLVDGIICEDTRRTATLLQHYQIHKPLFILNDFNEYQNQSRYLEILNSGQNLALVSDAGTPLVSDPGFKLVRSCLEQGIEVDSLPGSNSILPALTLSGLPPDKFMFIGYLPDKSGHRNEMLKKLQNIKLILDTTFIIFVSPHKLIKTLEEMKDVYGDIEVVLAKELSKMHQKVNKKILSLWIDEFKKVSPRGEYVMLFRL